MEIQGWVPDLETFLAIWAYGMGEDSAILFEREIIENGYPDGYWGWEGKLYGS